MSLFSYNCTIRWSGKDPEAASIMTPRQVSYMAEMLSDGESLRICFGYCRARLKPGHESVFKLLDSRSFDEVDKISRSITGRNSFNKEVYVLAERNGNKILWTIVSFYDWQLYVSDDPKALVINPL